MTSNQATNLDLKSELQQVAEKATAELKQADSKDALEAVRVTYLGRKGLITGMLRGLKDVAAEDRPAVGALANQIQEELEAAINQRLDGFAMAAINAQLAKETIDVTMPGVYLPTGTQHPITQVIGDICRIFEGMGFTVVDDSICPEVETEHYNFDALNFPQNHPAKDMQDTFYTNLGSNVLLRSQTSNGQIRYMEKQKPPLRIIIPGRVYRNEEVNSRKYVFFHQLEGLLVDKDIRFSDLKGVLHEFAKHFFADAAGEANRKTRFRASFFPFTEPSAEMDVQCILCSGNGCSVCSHTGWLEILGAGMVDPNVLKGVNIDPEEYTGFAFGMGIERLAMLKYAIEDIRLFFNGDLRFLRNFKA